jgi:hypothetical protein
LRARRFVGDAFAAFPELVLSSGEFSFFDFASSLHDDVVNDGVSDTKL